MSEKESNFQRLKKLLILITPTKIQERFTEDVKDWGILNSDSAIQKISFANKNIEKSMPHGISRLVKE